MLFSSNIIHDHRPNQNMAPCNTRGFLPLLEEGEDNASEDDGKYGLFLDGEEEASVPLNEISGSLNDIESLEAEESGREGHILKSLNDAKEAKATSAKQQRSSMKRRSSYGNLEYLGEGIPINTGISAWKTLPAPSIDGKKPSMKRAHSVSSFFPNSEESSQEEQSDDATETTESTSSSSNKMKRNVSFARIEIREHKTTIGNAIPTYGAPIGLGWESYDNEPICIDKYENNRAARKIKSQMQIPGYKRDDILADHLTRSQIVEVKKQTNKARNQRLATQVRSQQPILNIIDEIAESALRKVKRIAGKK